MKQFMWHKSPSSLLQLVWLRNPERDSSDGHVPVRGRQRQAYLCEFEASPVYRVSSGIARDTQRNPVSKEIKKSYPKSTLASVNVILHITSHSHKQDQIRFSISELGNNPLTGHIRSQQQFIILDLQLRKTLHINDFLYYDR